MDKDSFAFTVYLIHELAAAKKKTSGEIYKILKKYDCIDDYIVPYFDVLHTMGTEYLINDVSKYILQRGGTI